MRGFVSEIGSGHDDLFPRMFINVHEIVHDSFSSFVNRANAVRPLADDVFEFWVYGIFVNNWVILILSISFQSAISVVFDWLGGT